MSTFWVVAGALTLAVVALLAVPLIRRTRLAPPAEQDLSNVALFQDQLTELERDRDQGLVSAEQFEQARIELGQRLLADVPAQAAGAAATLDGGAPGAWRYAVLACVPIGAVLAYLVLGTPQAIDADLARRGNADQAHKLGQMVQQLAARLQANPDDAEAWVLLARSLQMLDRAPEAVKAYARATELVPNSAQLFADYADVQVASAEGQWTPAAVAAVSKALALDPEHPKALWLAGTEAYARKDYRAALGHWERLVPMAEPGSDVARVIQDYIAEVRGLLAAGSATPSAGKAGSEATSEATPEPAAQRKPTGQAGAVAGTVVLDPKLASRVKPTDTVFVFARAAQGPKMPLAIRRISVQQLPFRFSLDDSAAMAPGMTISAFNQVVVGARISRSGDAARKPGDLEGFSAPVKPGSDGIEVRINVQVE